MNNSAKTKRRRRRLAAGIGLAFGWLLIDYLAYPFFARPDAARVNKGENGLWLRYTWYFGRKSDSDLQRLAERLQRDQIRYAYFHVRSITKAGTLNYHDLTSARRLTSALHQRDPSVKEIAWIYAGNANGRGAVDLSTPTVRRAMVAEAVWLVNVCGFDGVQWDYEICPNDDKGFLSLMKETRAALPPGKTLSAAVPMWLPRPFERFGWGDHYFAQVAATCDQIAVMSYDTGAYLPRSYVWLVHQQVVHVTKAVAQANPSCRVLIGVPTYGKGGLSHHAHAENIRMAIIGVREGLADPQAKAAVFAGIAPFADYTTQPSDWQIYKSGWLRP